MPHRIRAAALVGILFTFSLAAYPVTAQRSAQSQSSPNAIERITTGSGGVGGGSYASISSDSRYIVFESTAPDMAIGQIEDSWDVFLYDREGRHAERVSVTSDGKTVYNSGTYSSPPAIASSGGHIAFMSNASNLVEGDTNGLPDIFFHDQNTGETRLVSASYNGGPANGPSYLPAISADGRYVAFQSFATNLVDGDTNDSIDIFVRDMETNTTERVSVTSEGEEGSDAAEYGYSSIAISDGGRWVAFTYEYLPIPGQNGEIGPRIYLRDRETGTTQSVATGRYPALSGSGRYLVFVTDEPLVANDRNNSADVYFVDRSDGAFERVSVTSSGAEAVLQGIFSPPDVSDDGQFVVFASNGGLVSGAGSMQHVYLRSRAAQTTSLISRSFSGSPANADSSMPVISGDGRCVAFTSFASDLVPGDENGVSDVFVFDRTDTVVTLDYALHIPLVLH